MCEFINPRNRQLRELAKLQDMVREDRLNRLFAQLDAKQDPRFGAGVDEEMQSDILEFSEYLSDR